MAIADMEVSNEFFRLECLIKSVVADEHQPLLLEQLGVIVAVIRKRDTSNQAEFRQHLGQLRQELSKLAELSGCNSNRA